MVCRIDPVGHSGVAYPMLRSSRSANNGSLLLVSFYLTCRDQSSDARCARHDEVVVVPGDDRHRDMVTTAPCNPDSEGS